MAGLQFKDRETGDTKVSPAALDKTFHVSPSRSVALELRGRALNGARARARVCPAEDPCGADCRGRRLLLQVQEEPGLGESSDLLPLCGMLDEGEYRRPQNNFKTII